MKTKILHFQRAFLLVLFTLLLSIAGVTNALAQTFTVGDFNYSINDDGVSVTVTGHVNGTAATGELVIPESVEYYNTSYAVTSIGEYAFQGCNGLTGSLNIPESVTTIGQYAFANCSGFTGELILPNSVTSIGPLSFRSCSGLTSATIPSSVSWMGNYAFYQCTGLLTMNYNAANCYLQYASIYSWIYGCTSLVNLNIGESVQVIPAYFLYAEYIGYIPLSGDLIIPDGVTQIGEKAFYNRSGYNGILSLGNSLVSIGADAFNGCSGLSGMLTIPNSVNQIGINAFSNCSGFSGTLTIGNSVTQIGNNAFFGACAGFNSFNVLAETPPNLGDNVFISVNYEIPVSVPCGSLSAYQNASGWSSFTNMQEPNPCMWEITATANPAEGGTVSGGGTYEQGTTCTLTATPAEGYEFVNWKENNTVVSEEATYSFIVEGNRTLTANFRLPPDPVGTVLAEYYPDPENSESPYVMLHWNGGIESFETGDFSMYDWQLDPTYLWQISTNNPYEGSYCMRSGGSGVGNVTSNMTLTVDYTSDGTLSFFSRTSSEGNWDYGRFYIDGQEMGNWSGETSWEEHTYTILAGSHTFQWRYTKDGSVNQGDDCFYVDNISFDGGEVSHYCVYRSGCDNGSFNLLADNVTDVLYTDNSWLQLAVGSYQYGVCAVYYNGTTSPMKISSCIEKHANVSVTITAVPNYEERGTISGAGNYLQGETCTLMATANEGFEFRNWMEDGQVVSTEAQYSFIVLTARNLVANFSTPAINFADANVKAICVSYWDTDGDFEITYDEAAAVTDIGDIFSNHNEITSFNELQYFTGLTSIGYYAFMNCTNLTSVVIPEGVTLLDYMAFAYSGLTEITIPELLNTTNNVVFEGCEALTVMNYNAINCQRLAGYDYSWLTGCNSLTTLNIGENVQSIPWGAFRGCSSLTGELTIPESVTSIASDAFSGTSFTTINYNATNCTYQNTYYHHGVFQGCETPASLYIGENVQVIPDYLFSGHTGLAGELVLPNALTSIGEGAFAECDGLTGSLVIPSSVVSIGASAFYSCSGFTNELNIPNSVTRIESGAFQNCSGFTGSLIIPNTVSYIGGWAFWGCTGLNGTLTISPAVEEIGSNAFSNTGFTTLNYNAVNCQFGYYYNGGSWFEYSPAISDCPSLTTLNIGEGVESISIMAFKDLVTLTGTLTLPNSLITIGDQAFYNCYGFEGIVMGNSVETIGSEAFRNCGGFRGELTLPETLQSVGNHAFASCDEITTITYNAINCTEMGNAQSPVFYDCASVAHINIGANVQNIPNYAFKRCSTVVDMSVAAEVPPVISASTFGTVSRNIPVSVPLGSSPAYRTAPYWEEFFHITEDYSSSPYTYHWSVNVHQFADNMTVTGIIQVEGVEQAVPSLEIGAFCEGECRGRQLLTYYPQVDRYLVFLMLYGEEGDMFTFRLYDHEAGEELTAGCASVLTFESDAIVGSFLDPYVFNFTDMQLTQFSQGWNWWSAYVELAGMDGLGQLEESLGDNGITIRSQAGYTDYYAGYGWYGSLSSIDNESSYKIKASAPCVAAMAGGTAVPSQHPITLDQGWTWMGYLPSFALDINTALAGLEATQGDKVKSQAGYSDYYPGYGWFGSLNTIEPGMGLMYYSTNGEAVTFTYPDGNRGGEMKANLTAENNHWVPNTYAYPDNMTVMAVVELNDMELTSDNYELAAFAANGECRGSVRLTYAEPLHRHVAFLTIAGGEAAELGFRLYNTETNEEYYDAEESLDFVANAMVGEANDLYIIHFRGTTDMDEFANRVKVYPNPVHAGNRFSMSLSGDVTDIVRVEIINSLGVVETLRATSLQTLTAPNVAGVYTLRITVEGKGTIVRKLVVK